nr:MAG: ORF1 [TTV-like mini virus]UGV35816.1 MAG: ORF1 [TTV-like mini virus]
MPYYNYYRRWNRWRPRYYRRRRPRPPFRRRFYRRRRRYTVRRKLKKIILREFQPRTIKRCTIKGLHPLFMANHNRLTNNLTQWLYSIAPEHFPSGGGFSITQYTLAGLFELHQKLENWWTNTNCNLPLTRYLGGSFKLYRQWETDYVFSYLTCYPMKSTHAMYMQCQPSMLMMTKNSVLVKCMKEYRGKRNYKLVKFRPPEQMQTKWYFQHDLCQVPLIVTLCSAASFTRYNLSAQGISTSIGFKCLNTKLFVFHNFQNYATTGYIPKNNTYLYGLKNGNPDISKVTAQNLIYLGAPGMYQQGEEILPQHQATSNWDTTVQSYFSDYKKWGNPFYPAWLVEDGPRVLTSNISPTQFKTSFPTKDTHLNAKMQQFIEPLIYNCRYNPNADTGEGNKIYLVPNIRDQTDWEPLNNNNLIATGFPLWTLAFGWIDWQKQQREAQQIDINYITVIVTNFINPKLPYYVVLDYNFLKEDGAESPYIGVLNDADRTHFYPKGTFQIQSLNEIGSSGPGIIKLPGTNSCEAHLEYKFRFKFGGCQAPMDKVCDPCNQAKYPIPNNFNETNSLQNPATPPETFLWQFDERRQQITEKAAKRLKTCSDIKEPVFSTAGTSLQLPAASHQETSTSESETTSEEEDQTLLQQLQHQRRRQRKYNQRILHLLKLIKNSQS